MRVQSLDGEDPLEEDMATHSSILDWEIQDKGACQATVPRGHKESDMTEATCHTCICMEDLSSPTRD